MRKLAIAAVASAILPGLLLAQADSSRMRDTTRRHTYRSSAGSIARRTYGLNHDQIMQLQTALKQSNCNPGAIDGVLGPHTRSAMACARQRNNITGNNPNDLFRSLNLGFTAPDSTGMGGVMRSVRRGSRSPGAMRADTSMRNMNMGNDTTRSARRRGTGRMRRGTRPDSTARPGITPRPGATTRRPGSPARPDTTRRP